MPIEAVIGTDTRLGGRVVDIATQTPTVETATLYVIMQFALAGHAADGLFFGHDGSDWDWHARVDIVTWPSPSHQAGDWWDYILAALYITGKEGGFIKVATITDDPAQPSVAVVTVSSGALDTAYVTPHTRFNETQTVAGAGLSIETDDYMLTTGTETANSHAQTRALDGIRHEHEDDGGIIDLYYEFLIGGTGRPVAVAFAGLLNGNNDLLKVYAKHWATDTWDQVGTLNGQNSETVNILDQYDLLESHVGTGDDAGKVWLRYYGTGLTDATLRVDSLHLAYSIVGSATGYEGGAVWIDTTKGTAGAVRDVNGVADNPVRSLADARVIADLKKLSKFVVLPGSSLTLDEPYIGFSFEGVNFSIDLNDQDVSGTIITGADIHGNDSGTNDSPLHLHDCVLNTSSFGVIHAIHCELAGVITITQSGHYVFEKCFSSVAGIATPSLDVGETIIDTDFSIRNYSGGLQFNNLGQAGVDIVTFEGTGQYILDASCVGGIFAVRGNIEKTDNSGGAVTIYEDARVTISSIEAYLALKHGPLSWEGEGAVSADGSPFDPDGVLP